MSGAIKINGTSSGSTTITAPASGGDESIELSTALAAKADVSMIGAGCIVLPSSAQSIPNGSTTLVNYGTEEYDPHGMFTSGTPTRITIPTGYDGLYIVTATFSFASNGTGQRQLTIQKNTAGIAQNIANPMSSYNVVLTVTAVAQMAAGDYFAVSVYQNSGGSLNGATNTRFSAVLQSA